MHTVALQMRPYNYLLDDGCPGGLDRLAGFQAAKCVAGKLPRALGLYDNVARVARLLRNGSESQSRCHLCVPVTGDGW